MDEEILFKTERARSRSEIAAELEAYATGLADGAVTLTGGNEERVVDVPEEATFEVELERQSTTDTAGDYFELEFELSWTE